MAETKLTNTRVPNMKPRVKSKKLGLLTTGKRKMCSFRLKYETLQLLDNLVQRGRKEINGKVSGSDVIEAALHLLQDLEKPEFINHCMKFLKD